MQSYPKRNLGVVITADLKSSAHSAQGIAAEQKAQKILGYIKQVFRSRNNHTVSALYRALVRPLLEYGGASIVQSPIPIKIFTDYDNPLSYPVVH